MPAISDRTESLFAAAVELSADRRAVFLDRECSGDENLRQQLEALLKAHDRANHLLDQPLPKPAGLAATSDHSSELVGTIIAGRYKLLEEIGEGGMGTVWVAEQTAPVRRKVAVKLIKAGMDSKAVLARFEAERQALAVMDHPNIAKVLDGGLTEAGRPFFVMEYVKGVPITDYCDLIRLNIRERLELFVQVCAAVQHAHQKGIIHRDLKPSNILVAPYDDRPVPKVIDFGLAKALHQRLTDRTLHTAHETVLGTPLYMSPEQAQLNNLDVDTRSDIYSLGVLLYELLTGTTPFENTRLKEAAWDEIRRIIRDEEPPRPSTRLSSTGTLPSLAACRQTEPIKLTQQIRGELDWIVMRALEKDRIRRYETASSFAADVGRYLRDEQVEACPPTTTYRLRKFLHKHRAGALTAVMVALTMLIGTLASYWQAYRAAHAEQRAVIEAQLARQAKEAEAVQRQRAEANEKAARESEQSAQQQRDAATQAQQQATQEKNNALAAREELRHTLYAAEMNLVQVSWEGRQYGRVHQLLQGQPADMRGFEWHYWRRRLHHGQLYSVQVANLYSKDQYKRAIAISRGGERLAAIVDYPDDDLNKKGFGLLSIFDGVTGRELIKPFDPFPDWREGQNKSRKVTMSHDGSRLAVTLGLAGEVRPTEKPFERISILDGKTGQEVCSIPSPGGIIEISLSSNGSQLAVFGFDDPKSRDQSMRSFKIWDTATGGLVTALPTIPRIANPGFVWSPDGSRLAQKCPLGEVNSSRPGSLFQVVEVASGKEIWRREIPNLPFNALNVWAWSPDGNYLVMAQAGDAGAKPVLQLWDSRTGQTLAILEREYESPIHRNSIDFSPDGRHMAALSASNEIYLWELPELSTAAQEGPTRIAMPNLTLRTNEEIRAIRFSPDGQELYSAGRTSLVTWDTTLREVRGIGPEPTGDFYGSYSIQTVAISPDRTKLALSGSGLSTGFAIWDLTADRELCRLKLDEEYVPSSPEFSPDGKQIALAKRKRSPEECQIVVHDTQTGEALHTFIVEKSAGYIGTFYPRVNHYYRPDGKQIAAVINPGSGGGPERQPRLMVWDTQTQKQLYSVNLQLGEGYWGQLRGYTPDGALLVVGSYDAASATDNAVVIYDAATGQEQRTIRLPRASRLLAVDFTSKSIVASLRTEENYETRYFQFWKPDGVVVLDLETGRERVRLSRQEGFECFEITPDGSRIILGNPDPDTRGTSNFTVWSLKSGRRLLEFTRQGTVSSLRLSPNGHRLIATFSRRPNLTSDASLKPIQIWDATPLPEKP